MLEHKEPDPIHVDHGAKKEQYWMNRGSSVIFQHALSFLLSSAPV